MSVRGFRDSNGNVHRLEYNSILNAPTVPTTVGDLSDGGTVVRTTDVATNSKAGIVRPDNTTITVSNGVLTAVGGGGSSNIPQATTQTTGGVKIDGETIKVNQQGQIYVDLQSASGVSF